MYTLTSMAVSMVLVMTPFTHPTILIIIIIIIIISLFRTTRSENSSVLRCGRGPTYDINEILTRDNNSVNKTIK